jgi:hypothetical protein
VYLAPIPVTRRGGGAPADLDKYLIVLQNPANMDRNSTQLAVVVASTDRTSGRGVRAFEVRLDDQDSFRHPTIVDGRWVYTFPRKKLDDAIYMFTLTSQCMDEISLAVFIGLQLTT